jgi:hypothetical protein
MNDRRRNKQVSLFKLQLFAVFVFLPFILLLVFIDVVSKFIKSMFSPIIELQIGGDNSDN